MGDRIQGAAGDNNRNVAQGKDIQQVSIYADAITWRETTQREFFGIHREIVELRGWVRGLLIMMLVFFVMAAVLTAFTIRQFDLSNGWIQYNGRSIEAVEKRLDRQGIP